MPQTYRGRGAKEAHAVLLCELRWGFQSRKTQNEFTGSGPVFTKPPLSQGTLKK